MSKPLVSEFVEQLIIIDHLRQQFVSDGRLLMAAANLDKTLKKLDLGPRSALILISSSSVMEDGSRSQASAYQAPSNPSQSSTPAAGGSYVGRILSYLNPFAYGKGGASADQQSSSNTPWQYGEFTTLNEIF